MKTKHLIVMQLTLILLLFNGRVAMEAQESSNFYSISGIVKDIKSKKKIEYVNVSAVGTNIGTITNEDGEFTLKLNDASQVKEIELSCIGYYNARISISKNNSKDQIFYITPQAFQLNEIEVFSWKNPRDLVETALNKVELNYSMKPNLLTSFYRETIQKKNKYIHISEAVIQVYKSPYNMNAEHDRVQVLKGRKLVSPKKNDTLDVKFLGGPNMPIYLDVVKNPDMVLSKEFLQYYSYKIGETTSINDRLQYVVHFEPQSVLPVPLYSGTFYIDRETFAFTRAEFSMDMNDKLKVIDAILKEKPIGLRFTPEEVSYVVTYKQQNGKTYLNYIRNEVKFKCDWKRKLFATNYTILNETIITNNEENNVTKIPARDAFSMRKSLSQEVSAYFDTDFWGSYNIIEPTESLENAVNKLKKQQQKSQ